MAFDLKVEIFAFKLFHTYFYDAKAVENAPDVLEIYGDECNRDNNYLEVLDDVFIRAFYERLDLVEEFYMSYVNIGIINDLASLSEICGYITYICDQNELFGNLSVFEKIFATTGFVIIICYLIHEEVGNIDVLKYSHIFWLIYFDKFTQLFYAEGGWKQLKLVAESYDLLSEMFRCLDINKLWYSKRLLKEAEVNYLHFKMFERFYKCKNSKHQQRDCISKLWVMVRIQYFESYNIINSDYEERLNAWEFHNLLYNLRVFCDPLLTYNVLEYVKTYNFKESFVTGKGSNLEDSIGIDDGLCNAFYNKLNFENKFKSKSLISSSKVVDFNVANKAENVQFDNNIRIEKEMQQYDAKGLEMIKNTFHKQYPLSNQTIYKEIERSLNKNLPSIVDDKFSRKSYVNDNEKDESKELVSTNDEAQVMSDALPTNQKVEHECIQKMAPTSHCNLKDIGCLNECTHISNETLDVKEKVEANLNSEDGPIENSKLVNIEPNNQITAIEIARKSFAVPFRPKEINPVVQSAGTGGEMEIIWTALEDLKEEQANLEIKKFLRLILILDDKQGLKYVTGKLNKKKRNKNKKSSE